MNTFTEAPEGSVVETEKMMPKLLFFWRPIHRDYGFLSALGKSCVPILCVPMSYGGEKAFSSLHFQWTKSTYQKQEDKHMNCCVNHVFG